MARTRKMTFTLDKATADRIALTARRLGIAQSRLVREAVAEYTGRSGELSEGERLRLLATVERLMRRKPTRSRRAVDREIADIRRARRSGGRRTRTP